MNKQWIVDIEMYPNLFLLVGKNKETKEIRKFQISQYQDDRHDLIKFIREDVELLIGFNILSYDYPLIHYFGELYTKNLSGSILVAKLKQRSNELANSENSYKNVIKTPIRRIRDLFKIRHYDNRAKMTSLKLLAFNLRMVNVQELPYHHTQVLTEEEIKKVIEYCINDVNVTEVLHENTLEDITLREELGRLYQLDMTNYSDAKIGQEIFVKIIKQELGIERIGRTPRPLINLKDVVFDYITFNSREFTLLLRWFKDKTISQTIGTFTEIPFEELTTLEGVYSRKVKKGCQKDLNIVYKGFEFVFGVGGIHGSIKSGIYLSDNEYSILDVDVSSFYPNLAIVNWLYPEHLGRIFCKIYDKVYNERKKYPKKTAPNVGLKYALNIIYGKSNSEYSPFYDPLYTMRTTINGQLLLVRFAEEVMENLTNIELLQANTDGVTFKLHNSQLDKFRKIIKWWEEFTKLELEESEYDKMIIRDVNNYSARYKKDGTIKRKGAAFMYKISPTELELHKNHSMLVVPKAVEKYFYEGILPEDFIPEYANKYDETKHEETKEYIYDFFKRVKLPKKFKLFMAELHQKEEIRISKKGKETAYFVTIPEIKYKLQNITRYYISKTGYTIVKQMPPSKDKVEDRNQIIEQKERISSKQFVSWLCTDCNDLRGISLIDIKNNLDFEYYIQKTRKIIEAVEGNGELDNEENEDES